MQVSGTFPELNAPKLKSKRKSVKTQSETALMRGYGRPAQPPKGDLAAMRARSQRRSRGSKD